MKYLILVNESPWGGTLPAVALRFAAAVVNAGHVLVAVYFRQDGVYHVVRGRAVDDGLPPHRDAWVNFQQSGTELLVCSADATRRLDAGLVTAPFAEAGLARFWALAAAVDRVVTF